MMHRVYTSLMLVVLIVQPIQAIRVLERWSHLKTNIMRCSIAITDAFGSAWLKSPQGQSFIRLADKANCSFAFSSLKTVGEPNSTGSYNGYIGIVQRHEVDGAFIVVRVDTLPYEPVKFTPPMYAADVAILSVTKGKEVNIERGVISFLDLELPVLTYTVFALFFAVPILLVHDERRRKNIINPIMYVKCYLKCCEMTLNLLLDQEQFSPRHLFAYILAFTSSVFMLTGVFGILLNTLGSNMIVKREPHPIDTLNDLLMSGRTPMVSSALFAGRVIESAPEGTKLHQLRKLIKHVNANLDDKTDYDQFFAHGIVSFTTRLTNYSAVYLLAREWASILTRLACFFKGRFDAADRLHLSRESFASGIMTSIMSTKIHPYPEKIISYILNTVLETGQALALTQISKPELPDLLGYPGMKYDIMTLTCIEDLREINDEKFISFSVQHLSHVFNVWASFCALGCLILFFESMNHDRNCKISRHQGKSVTRHCSKSHRHW